MAPGTPSPRPEDVREQIVDAARLRFERYGFRKTTMTEIADDVGMSPANLYRYFENKHDICAVCASRCMAERTDALRRTARAPGAPASERLGLFFKENLRITYETSDRTPHIGELVENISTLRPDLVQENIEVILGLIAEILAHGNATGEFDVDDVIGTARAVHATMILFEVPMFTHLMPRPALERVAGDVTRLVLRGLDRRSPAFPNVERCDL